MSKRTTKVKAERSSSQTLSATNQMNQPKLKVKVQACA